MIGESEIINVRFILLIHSPVKYIKFAFVRSVTLSKPACSVEFRMLYLVQG